MFIPKHFRQQSVPVLHQTIRRVGLGTLVTWGEGGMDASHVPMVIEADPAPFGTLHGHLARANLQWKRAAADFPALAIFLGPDAYITPSWYPTTQKTGKVVPTWNYVAVHAYGTIAFFDDPSSLKAVVTKLTEAHETARTDPWQVTDAPATFIDAMLKGIIGFKLVITKLEGKWKLSQNRPQEDIEAVGNGLRADGHLEMAAAMQDGEGV